MVPVGTGSGGRWAAFFAEPVATVTGAVRRFLIRRGSDVDAMEGFRTALPVNIRKAGGSTVGNQVALLLADLPVSEPDALERLRKVIEVTTKLKKRAHAAARNTFVPRSIRPSGHSY